MYFPVWSVAGDHSTRWSEYRQFLSSDRWPAPLVAFVADLQIRRALSPLQQSAHLPRGRSPPVLRKEINTRKETYYLIHFTTIGAAPDPVPPPIPAVTNTKSLPATKRKISLRLSSAALRPLSGTPPAPKPRVTSLPTRENRILLIQKHTLHLKNYIMVVVNLYSTSEHSHQISIVLASLYW